MKNGIFLLCVAMVMGFGSMSQAAISKELTYSEDTVWRCAVRFLRVDSGYKILEKDKETGYLLFEYAENGATYNGSFEVLKRVVNNHEVVRVQVNLHGQPKYMESLLFNKLEKKLKNEYGMAPAPKYVGPPTEDAGTEKDAKPDDGKAVDEDATEEDLRITEDDLNADQKYD
ncbi:MAG: hypothetical protein JXX29_16630 [Deltaproteobacteria bacterium]|nr:hypothetical protein [Deltaproteobacteria bacterium]MBN2673311.1 hypothetical protein [Deltaproteobacteria bacterium]